MTCTRSLLRFVLALALALFVPWIGGAEGYDGDDSWDHPWDDPNHEGSDDDWGDSANAQEKLAAKFGVEEWQIAGLRDQQLGYGEIDHTLTLAERLPGGLTDENVNTILEMRQDQKMGWGQIAHAQDTTLGAAKRERMDPQPEPCEPSDAQPKSVSRPGKSAAASGSGASAGKHGGASSGGLGSGHASGRSVGASARHANSGNALGHGASHGSSAKAGGKAKGHK